MNDKKSPRQDPKNWGWVDNKWIYTGEEKIFRNRRGKLVEIPNEWVGKVCHPQTIRKRKSKKGQGRRYLAKAQR